MRRMGLSTTIAVWLVLIGGACDPTQLDIDVNREPLLVATSVEPLAELVRYIGRDFVETLTFVPANTLPSEHEPRLVELTVLSRADVYVKVGHPDFTFETKHLKRMLLHHPRLPVVDCHDFDLEHGETFPWLSPRSLDVAVRRISAALEAQDPDHAQFYATNARQLLAEIDALDDVIRERIRGCGSLGLVVFHTGWRSFAEAYGIDVIEATPPPGGWNAARERDVEARASALGARLVVVTPYDAPPIAERLAEAIDGEVARFNPLAPNAFERAPRLIARLAAMSDCGHSPVP